MELLTTFCRSSWRGAQAARAGERQLAVQRPVPQIYADVDRDKVLKQGMPISDVYQTLQAFLGGLYLNQFNRFGRQWRVFLQAEGEDRRSPRTSASSTCGTTTATWFRCRRCTRRQAFGPEYTNRFNLYRAAQVTGVSAPGYSSGQASTRSKRSPRRRCRAEMGYDWADLSDQERKAAARGTAVRPVADLRLLILAALYESWSLPFCVLLSVPVAVFGAFAGSDAPVRTRCLRADRPDDAHRACGEERHPDRRVREGTREEGKDLVDAALEGAQLRLRPI